VAGVLWARGRSQPAVPAGDTAPARRTIDPATEAALPDVTEADAFVDLGDVRLVLSVSPRPIMAFATNTYRVKAEADGAAVPLEGGRISFEMSMPMGDHRHALLPAADG
jgi:hypothetical protein